MRNLSLGIARGVALACVLSITACDSSPPPSGGGDGGLVLAPGQVAPGMSVTGTTPVDGPAEYFIDLPKSGSYVLVVGGNTFTATLNVYANAARTELETSCNSIFDTTACLATLDAGRHYLGVQAGSFGGGGPFSFSITPLADLGSSEQPLVIGSDPTTRFTVTTASSSYFRFDVPESGAYDLRFGVDLVGGALGDATLTAFSDPSFTGTPLGSCDSSYLYGGVCGLYGLAPGPIFVRVDATSTKAALFELAPVHTLGVGAPSAPVAIDASPATTAVDAWSRSYYGFTPSETGSYRVTFGGTTTTTFRVNAKAGGVVIASCTYGTTCLLSGLDAGTPIVLEVYTSADTHFDVSVARGVAVGSPTHPVDIALGNVVTGSVDAGGESYYRISFPTSGYYDIDLSALSPSTSLRFEWGTGSYPPSASCSLGSTTPCTLGPIASGTTLVLAVSAGTSAANDYTFVIAKDPVGEGTAADPNVLTVGMAHMTSVGSRHATYERFVTDASGGDYEVQVTAPAGVYVNGLVSCPSIASGARVCSLKSLAPNTNVDFNLTTYTSGATYAVTLRVAKITPSAGCENGSTVCYDFESGTVPAGLSISAGKSFTVTGASAITGGYGLQGGTASPSCASFVTPASSTLLGFSYEVVSPTATDALTVQIDSNSPTTYAASSVGGNPRRVVLSMYSGTHTIQMCWTHVGTSPYAYLDDISVR